MLLSKRCTPVESSFPACLACIACSDSRYQLVDGKPVHYAYSRQLYDYSWIAVQLHVQSP